MNKDSLPSSIYNFREFLYKHPGLIREVREGKTTWNDLYQDWVVLGEDHEIWAPYQLKEESENKSKGGGEGQVDSLASIMKLLNSVNIQDLQKQISQFSGMMGNVQQVLQHFQKPSGPSRPPQPPHDPFSFRGF